EQLRARDQLRGALAAAVGDEGVDIAVDDERRHLELLQAVGPTARRQDAQELTSGARRVEGPVVGLLRPLAGDGLVEVLRAPDQLARLDAAGDRLVTGGRCGT